jgi:hypothetical protein
MAWLAGAVLALSACQPLEGLLKLKPDLTHAVAPSPAAVGVDVAATGATTVDASATPSTPAEVAADAATPTPAPSVAPTATPTPFLTFGAAPQGADPALATPTPKPVPTATPTPSQPQTCTRTRQVTSTGGPQHGRFNGAILPREWASVYANEDEILRGIDNVYQTDWACFQVFYPDATRVYKQLRGRS